MKIICVKRRQRFPNAEEFACLLFVVFVCGTDRNARTRALAHTHARSSVIHAPQNVCGVGDRQAEGARKRERDRTEKNENEQTYGKMRQDKTRNTLKAFNKIKKKKKMGRCKQRHESIDNIYKI